MSPYFYDGAWNWNLRLFFLASFFFLFSRANTIICLASYQIFDGLDIFLIDYWLFPITVEEKSQRKDIN